MDFLLKKRFQSVLRSEIAFGNNIQNISDFQHPSGACGAAGDFSSGWTGEYDTAFFQYFNIVDARLLAPHIGIHRRCDDRFAVVGRGEGTQCIIGDPVRIFCYEIRCRRSGSNAG